MMQDGFAPMPDEASIARAAHAFEEDGLVRLEGVLVEAAARGLHRFLAEEAEWWRTVNRGDKVWDLGPRSIAQLEDAGQAPLEQAIHEGAREGFQFVYDTVRVSDDPRERAARGLPVDALLDAFNRPAWLALLRRITGEPAITLVDGQATRYLPGHFLTGHDDSVPGKGRIAAYVLGLTPRWRTEWGGLLLFHGRDGDVARGLAPRFNALTLFRVPRPHSVSPVAPFAGAPRYSVTGWLRTGG